MTDHPTRTPSPPHPDCELSVDLLMRALKVAVPVALLDRIEAAR